MSDINGPQASDQEISLAVAELDGQRLTGVVVKISLNEIVRRST
jgi:hypothetical protein